MLTSFAHHNAPVQSLWAHLFSSPGDKRLGSSGALWAVCCFGVPADAAQESARCKLADTAS